MIDAMNRLSDALLGRSRVTMLKADTSTMTQHEKALYWLDVNPNRSGMSQRDMAAAARVGLPTMQRALKQRQAEKQSTMAVQNKLF